MERHRSLEMAPPPPFPPPNQITQTVNRLSAFDSPTTSSGCSSSASAAPLHQKPTLPSPTTQNNNSNLNQLGNMHPQNCTSNEGSLSDKSVSWFIYFLLLHYNDAKNSCKTEKVGTQLG